MAPAHYALVLVVLLAGCSMPAGDGPSGETVTPVPATDIEGLDGVAGANETAVEVTPDQRDGGSFAALLDEHERQVANSSYTYRINATRLVGSRTDARAERVVSGYRGVNDSVYYFRYESSIFGKATWSNGTVRITKWGRGTEQSYEVSRQSRAGDRADGATYLRNVLSFARLQSVSENDTHDVYTATLLPDVGEALPGPGAVVENATITLSVTTDGVIESYRFEMTGYDENGDRVRISQRFSLDRSADTLPRPDWVDEALASERDGA